MNWKKHRFPLILMAVIAAYSCASIGAPDGGPYDEEPPRFVGSTPELHATGNQKSRIELEFDEFIKLEKAAEKVVISPPQMEQPEIKVSGKKVVIELIDSLKDSTTYTVDFSDAIVDNNEGNPMGNFSFSFSTGESIDTLEVSGTVLNAADLEPVKGMLVGLHKNLNDTAFTTLVRPCVAHRQPGPVHHSWNCARRVPHLRFDGRQPELPLRLQVRTHRFRRFAGHPFVGTGRPPGYFVAGYAYH